MLIESDDVLHSKHSDLPSGYCQEEFPLVDPPVQINSNQEESCNDSGCSRLEHNHESCCVQENKDVPSPPIKMNQNEELFCASSANRTSTIRSFSSIAEENDEDDASSKSHCYGFFVQHLVLTINSSFSSLLNHTLEIIRKMRPDGITTLFGEKRIPDLMEQSIRACSKDKTITLFKPEVGMIFGSASEAYQFYNLYSWVLGFSIRSDDSHTNTKGERTMQEFRCQCEGVDKKTKLSSTRCGCRAWLRLLRSVDLLWYVKIFDEEHNHVLVESCGQKKHLFSHRHIDDSTKTMVRHLRENNVSLSRINGIVGSFYGRPDGVPFIKKALRTLCSDIAAEALKDDVRKTIEGFRDNIAQDKRFVFSMQLDANKN